jgi:hypothetical protein
MGAFSSGVPSGAVPFCANAAVCCVVAYGAITRCEPCGRFSRPDILLELQMKQFTSRGSLALKNW